MTCLNNCCQYQIGAPCPFGLMRIQITRLVRQPIMPVGELCGLIYRTRRSPGEPLKKYVHFFKDKLPILATNLTRRRLYILGGKFRVTKHGIEN